MSEGNITLTKIERLMLSNQFKILEALYPDESEYYSNKRKVLEEGYSLHYKELIECFFDELSTEECIEVIDILDMYSALLKSYEKLTDKSGINEYLIKFHGFDGNNEPKQRAYTIYFMHDLDRFNELHQESKEYNSHCTMLPKYRRMLSIHKTKEKQKFLSKDEINSILNA